MRSSFFDKDLQQLFIICPAQSTPHAFKTLNKSTQMRLIPVCLRILKNHELPKIAYRPAMLKCGMIWIATVPKKVRQ
jgi:hypothetical protein